MTDPKTGAGADSLIAMGIIKGAHGVRGEVRVKSFTDDPGALFSYGPLLDADGTVLITPASVRPGTHHHIVRPRESRPKEAWDALRGTRLHVYRSRLPEPADEEFYIGELIGLRIHAGQEGLAGRVRSVQNFGAGDLLEIEVAGLARTVLVPLTRSDVTAIDLASGRIEIPDLALWIETSGPG